MYNKHGQQYPHEGNCVGCREGKRCNVCAMLFTAPPDYCTNGRCFDCHTHVCAKSGSYGPCHGYGSEEDATRQANHKHSPGPCSQCGNPRPPGYTKTCGKSECQQAEHAQSMARRFPSRTRKLRGYEPT